MIMRIFRPATMGLVTLGLIACMGSQPTSPKLSEAVPLGIDLGGSGPVIASLQPQSPTPATQANPRAATHNSDIHMAHAGRNDAHGTGTVNSVDPAQHRVNLSHQPIAEIGWPAMTMDFPVAGSVDLRAIKPGTRVNFTIEQQPGGMYQIQAISPAGGQ